MEKITTLLGNLAWLFLAVIIPLVAIWVSWKQIQRKALSYEVISSSNILDIPNDFKDKLEIYYEAKPIQQLYLIIIKIINTGNTPITLSDYHKPISIGFGNKAEVLSFEVLKQTPSNLGAVIKNIQPSSVEYQVLVEPMLLNVNDSFTIKTLITKFKSINFDVRIAGVKSIREMMSLSSYRLFDSFILSILFICIIPLYLVGLIYIIDVTTNVSEFVNKEFNILVPSYLFSLLSIILFSLMLINSISSLIEFLYNFRIHRRQKC